MTRPWSISDTKRQPTLVWVIRAYQYFVKPAFPPACRFSPSCSEYAIESIVRYGTAGGLWLAIRRLVRCHPYHPGGFDPVP